MEMDQALGNSQSAAEHNMVTQCETESTEDTSSNVAAQYGIRRSLLEFVPPFALRAACQLRIFDIVEAGDASSTLTTEEVAAHLPSKTVATQQLYRLLRLLAQMGYLTSTSSTVEPGEKETRFGRTALSRTLCMDVDDSAANLLLMLMDERFQKPWHYISDCILSGKSPGEHAYGTDLFTVSVENPKANAVFQKAMTSSTISFAKGILAYNGFRNIKKLVDVGGGVGMLASIIVAAHPHIQAVNFDLPHVLALAPQHPGVEFIEGNMFEYVPSGDAILLKNILHNWDDEDCVKILKNVHKALPDEGRVLVADLVMGDKNNTTGAITDLCRDMLMMALSPTGMERTQKHWQKLLECSGFTATNFMPCHTLNLIEAFKSLSQPIQ